MIEFWTTRIKVRLPNTTFMLDRAERVAHCIYSKSFVGLSYEEQLRVATTVHRSFSDTQLRRGEHYTAPIDEIARVDDTTIRGRTAGVSIFLKCSHFEGPW